MVFKLKFKLGIFTFLTILLAGGLLSGGILMASDDACAADDEYVFYSYTVSFSFDGERGEQIEWDFGDGTPNINNQWLNVEHTYEAIGTYTVKQTVTNNYGTDVAEITIRIEGHPKVTFISGDKNFISSIEVPYIDGVAQVLPESVGTPEMAGEDFEDWYYDNAFTQKWTPEDKISQHETLYAKWTGIYVDEVPSFDRIFDDYNSNMILNYYIPEFSMSDPLKNHDLSTDIFEHIGNNTITVTIYNENTGDTVYRLIFNASGKTIQGDMEKMDLRIELIYPEGNDLEAAKESGASKVAFLKFYSSGVLPYGVDVEYYFDGYYLPGDEVDLVYMNGGKLTDEVQKLTISDNGTIRFTLLHCSTYAVLGYGESTSEFSTLCLIIIAAIAILIITILIIIFAIRRRKETKTE